MKKTRIFFTTDIHGSEKCFLKFVNAGPFYNAQVIIMGGDITGKVVVPLVEQTNGFYKATIFDKEQVFPKEELPNIEKQLRIAGSYPYQTTPDELTYLQSNKQAIDELFLKLMQESIQRWIEIAASRLQPKGIRCMISPGNDDHLGIDQVLQASDFLTQCEGQIVQLTEDHEMLSLGWSTFTPWNSPRECSEEELERRIEDLVKNVHRMEKCVFNLHCPPYQTPIDLAPQLDEKMRPIIKGGSIMMVPVGSKAVRECIERYQPLLGLHGHIHESRGFVRIGRTICINPGSEYGEGILRGCLVDLSGDQVSYTLVSG